MDWWTICIVGIIILGVLMLLSNHAISRRKPTKIKVVSFVGLTAADIPALEAIVASMPPHLREELRVDEVLEKMRQAFQEPKREGELPIDEAMEKVRQAFQEPKEGKNS
jgi:hypothetical protein